jgi:hypothetical protein
MAKRPKPLLHDPPFPPLTWDGYSWTGEVVLRSWAGFEAQEGPDFDLEAALLREGRAELYVQVEESDDPPAPNEEQAAAYRFLLSEDKVLGDTVLEAVFATYLSEDWGYGEDDEEYWICCPPIERPSQLRTLMELAAIHILTISAGGLAYIGFIFGCTFESEHGLGVMTHGDRIVKIGGADFAFNAWIARADAQSEGTP